MAEQRQPFRFRLPWLPAPAAPRPSPTGTPAQPAPIQSTATGPFIRPQFRPPGIGQVQPAPPAQDRTQIAPRIETQVQSPPLATIRSPPLATIRSPPLAGIRSPPFGAARSPVSSQPSSPVRATYQFRGGSLPSSPTRGPSSQPTSPSRTAARNQLVSQSASPSKKLQSSIQESSRAAPSWPREIKPAVFQMRSQEPQTKSKDQKILGTTKEETEERKKVEQELIKEEKANGSAYEITRQRTEVEVPAISPPSKAQINERKEILSTSGSGGKQSKMVISTLPKDRSPASEPRPKPATINGGRVPLHKEIREDIIKFVHKLTTGRPKQPADEKPISITSLVGENRGASMLFVPESAKKEPSLHIHRGYKANTDEGSIENTSEGEGSSKKDSMTKVVQPNKAYINSNVQSINNSISLDASVTEKNPGVILGISNTATAPAKFGSKEEHLEAHKAEFSVTPSQKLTYDPAIKRRCLRGLFLESSDSDPDNPEKPRRHGCRYNACGDKEKTKGNNMDAL